MGDDGVHCFENLFCMISMACGKYVGWCWVFVHDALMFGSYCLSFGYWNTILVFIFMFGAVCGCVYDGVYAAPEGHKRSVQPCS
jgi:uncharacterized membrane protein